MKVLDYEGLEHFKEKLLEQVSEMITASAPPPDMDYVIETYGDQSIGYRLWKSGWCEQWGLHDHGSSANSWKDTVTLLVPMKWGVGTTTTYMPSNGQVKSNINSLTSTAIEIWAYHDYGCTYTQQYVFWMLEGMME